MVSVGRRKDYIENDDDPTRRAIWIVATESLPDIRRPSLKTSSSACLSPKFMI